MEIHWSKILEIDFAFDEDINSCCSGFYLNGEFWSLDLCVRCDDDYFDGVIGITNTSAFMVKLLPAGDAVFVACVS